MATTTVPVACPDEAVITSAPSGASRTATVIASALWVFVGGLLAYGIVQTAIKAVALFG